MKKLPPSHYSGKASRPFWNRVRRAMDHDQTLVLYVAALHLQDVEARVRQLLEQAELHPGRRRLRGRRTRVAAKVGRETV